MHTCGHAPSFLTAAFTLDPHASSLQVAVAQRNMERACKAVFLSQVGAQFLLHVGFGGQLASHYHSHSARVVRHRL